MYYTKTVSLIIEKKKPRNMRIHLYAHAILLHF